MTTTLDAAPVAAPPDLEETVGWLKEHADRVKQARLACREEHNVHPGSAARFTEAASPGDALFQGEVILVVSPTTPEGYCRMDHGGPSGGEQLRKLTPGPLEEARPGQRHMLDSLAGVEIWYPPGGLREDSYEGPWFVAHGREVVVVHEPHGAGRKPNPGLYADPDTPTSAVAQHGPITIPAGVGVLVRYQRAWDVEESRSRRMTD